MKQLIYILFLLLIISCKSNTVDKPKKPENLISKDKMVNVIYDISLINSAKGVNKTLLENNGISPEDYIYKKHNIDSLQFVLSNDYYAYNLKTYENIYNSVKVKLEKDKTRFQVIVDTEQKAKDSLNKVIRNESDSLRKIRKSKLNTNELGDSLKLIPLKKLGKSHQLTRQ